MRGFGLLAALAILGGGEARAATPGPATPLGDPAGWIVTTDYPGDALAMRAEGEVGFVLTVGPDGRVADCRIDRSSGSDVLDRATCRLLTERARFNPARGADGGPVQGSYAGRYYWLAPFQP
jgi:protein TonB